VTLLIALAVAVDARRHATQGDAMIKCHIVADLAGLADHHAHAVVDEEAPADLGARVDLDSREPAAQLGDSAPDQAPAARPEGMRNAIEQDRLEAGIEQRHLEAIAGRRVAGDHGIDVFAQILEHLTAYHAMIADSFRLVQRGDGGFLSAKLLSLDIVCRTKLVKFRKRQT
jgi:hypothetical protein